MASKKEPKPGRTNTKGDIVVSVSGGGNDNDQLSTNQDEPDEVVDDTSENLEENTSEERPPIFTESRRSKTGLQASGLARTAFARFDKKETKVQLSEHWVYQNNHHKKTGRI
jgi:hypothetical protein